MRTHPSARALARCAVVTLFALFTTEVHAQRPRRDRSLLRGPIVAYPAQSPTMAYPAVQPAAFLVPRPAAVSASARVVAAPRSAGALGSGFVSTPYMFVRGNGTAGGGYSPLGLFGDATMALYGPLSGLRATSAPVLTYSRGYNGTSVVTPATSFSTPNLPGLTPVVYPTQATNYFGFRRSGEPPWFPNAMDWIDQN